MLRRGIALLVGLLLGMAWAENLPAADLRAGVSVVDITAPKGYRMSGYFHERLNTGTHDPLQAKALVLRQGGEQAALVFCDLIGLSRDVSSRARELAAKKTGIPAANILIAATHSHTGPLYMGALRQYFHDQTVAAKGEDPHEKIDYPAFLVEKLAGAIQTAQNAARPVDLSAGMAHQEGLSFNRRFHMKDGTVQFNPGKLNPNIVRVAGPIDPDVGLLRLRAGDKDLALLTVFALHLDTVGGTEYSADYPFHLERKLRSVLGAEGVSLFGTGTCGDINHINVSNKDPQKGQTEAGRIGTTLGDTVQAALPKLKAIRAPSLAVRRAVVNAPLQKYSAEAIAQAKKDMAKIGTRDLPFLKQVEAYKIVSLQSLPGETLPMEVQVFRLSDEVAIVGLPGEIFVELGLAIKKASPFPITLVVELCNDTPGYVPTVKAFKEGSYETVNSRVQPGGGEKLVEAATKLLRELAAAPAATSPARRGPQSPAEALKEFHIAPGLRLELVAAEPEIESPVAMAFDEDGKLWVVEMRDYPNGPAPGQPPEGRIRILEDRDGDGRYEHSRIFAERLLFANGVLPWKGGVVVTAAPHILYLKDTDGDGRADQREILYEGFADQNPQLRVSHPILGLDNWVYVANGLRGGLVKRHGRADAKPVNISGRDFRFDLVRDRHEAVSGMGQYGNTFDDWGRRFVCDNHDHLRHIVLPNRYLGRNPYLAVAAVFEDVSELEPGPLSSGGLVYPLSRNWTTSNLHAGRFTAACGVTIYRGDLLPPEHRGAGFTCEPTGNLVHEEILRPHGATFRSRPARDKVEFLATPDDWFRPVSLAHGPDGALYVVDMYRAVIEHPDFMPPELKRRPDLILGKDRGRIWRIVPEGHKTTAIRPKLSRAATADLVPLLAHANAWWRTTAQRLLLERQDRAAIEPLRKLCTNSDRPLARIHAAWALEGLQALDTDLAAQMLRDKHPRVREQALILCERWLPTSAAIQNGVLALAADADDRVRYQAALSLGEWDDDRIVPALATIAAAGADDPWTRAAVASSVPRRAGALLAALLKGERGLTAKATPGRLALVRELAALVGARQEPNEVAGFLDVLQALPGDESIRWQMAGLNGLADGMGRRGRQLSAFLHALPADKRKAADAAETLLDRAGRVATESNREPGERLDAVRLLAHAQPKVALPVLSRLLNDDPTPDIRLAAVRALSAQPSAEVPRLLMKSWASYTPALRREVAEAMLRQPDRTRFLLGELEAKRVAPGDLDVPSKNRLMAHGQADIRQRAVKLLQASVPEERKQVLQRYRESLTRKGDAGRGREVFRQNCATCHRVADVGTTVGPDISDTRTKTPEMLLQDILNPNAAIDANYVNYTVVTKSGKEFTGLIAAESASSITLRRAENQTDLVLRQDIDEIRSSGVSLMPEGLEKTITLEQMADLISFLKNWRYLDGKMPGVGAEK